MMCFTNMIVLGQGGGGVRQKRPPLHRMYLPGASVYVAPSMTRQNLQTWRVQLLLNVLGNWKDNGESVKIWRGTEVDLDLVLFHFKPFSRGNISLFFVAMMMKSSCLLAMHCNGLHEHIVASSGAKWIYGSSSQLLQKSFFAICFFTMYLFRVLAKFRMRCNCCKLSLLHN